MFVLGTWTLRLALFQRLELVPIATGAEVGELLADAERLVKVVAAELHGADARLLVL